MKALGKGGDIGGDIVFDPVDFEAIVLENALTDEEKEAGWMLLFDGEDPFGWRAFNGTEFPEGWTVEDGALKALGKGGDIGGDIVFGPVDFEEFELEFTWKIAPGGNSGVFYHVVEGPQYKAPYETGPEYQVIDQLGFPEPLEDWQSIAADYAMYPADLPKELVYTAEKHWKGAHYDHFGNWFTAIRTGGTVAEDPVFGLRAAAPALLCNDSFFQNKFIQWDPVNMKLI